MASGEQNPGWPSNAKRRPGPESTTHTKRETINICVAIVSAAANNSLNF